MAKRLNENEFIETIENTVDDLGNVESAINDAATMENFIRTRKKKIFWL